MDVIRNVCKTEK